MVFLKKNKHFKALCWTFLLLVILNVGSVYAAEWDNVKSYDPETKTITITNALGLGDIIATVQLNTPIKYKVARGYNKVAQFTITSYEDYNNALKELELYDRKHGMNKFIRDFDYKYLTYEDVEINDYGDCLNAPINGLPFSCVREIIGTHTEQREKWIKLTPAVLKKNDITVIGIFTEVNAGDRVEWIPNFFGVRADEWAEWTESLNVDLEAYYTFDTDGTDDTGNGNDCYGGNARQVASGKLGGGSMEFLKSSSEHLQCSAASIHGNITNSFTINFWANMTDETTFRGINELINTGTSNTWIVGDWGGDTIGFNCAFTGSCPDISGGTTVPANYGSWTMITVRYNSTDIGMFGNGVHVRSGSAAGNIQGTGNLTFGRFSVTGLYSTMQMDEYGLWSRDLSESEITALYNSGAGIEYTEDFNNDPEIIVNNPEDNLITTDTSIDFNCTTMDNSIIENSSLFINGIINYTVVNGATNYTEIATTLNMGDGFYNWSCAASDDNDPTVMRFSPNRTIIIDNVNPIVNITLPINGSNFLTSSIPLNVTLGFTATDNHLSSCWLYNTTENITLTCGENTSLLLDNGNRQVIYYVNDTIGNEVSTSTSFIVNYYYHNATYPDPATEQQLYDFKLNVTANNLGEFNGSLWYNGTIQPTSYSDNGTSGILNASIQTGGVGNVLFNWVYYINGEKINASFNHNVNVIQDLNVVNNGSCPTGLEPALHYDFKNEQNDTAVNATIDYIFKYGITNSTLKTTSGNTIGTELTVCINSTVSNNYSLGYGEIQYEATGYTARRYYTFSSDRLTNASINNSAYSLPAGSSTSFLFTIQKGDLSVFDDVYLTLNRWYPDEDTYKVVEMARTDDEGQTVQKVEIEDVDYRVGVYYQNGSLIYLAAPFRLVCIATPCTYSLIVPEDAGNSFESWKNLQVSLTYNETLETFTFTYNDPSQDTSAFNLSVYRDTGLSELLICTDSSTGYTGVLTCNVTGYTGMLRAAGFRTASPETNIITKTVNQGIESLEKTPALFITLIVMILLVLIGIVSPIATVILAVLGFVPALMFGIMPLPILLTVAAMGFIVIHFMKRSVSG